MSPHRPFPRGSVRAAVALALSAAAIALGGCRLEHRPIVTWAKVEPALHCPGDTVTASYDFLSPETCPADAQCERFAPNIVVTATPAVFPERRPRAFTDSVSFVPATSRVDVRFDSDRDTVTVPTARFDGGTRIFVNRTQVLDTTRSTTLLVGTDRQVLPHPGDCIGGAPRYMPVQVPGMPRLSPRVRLQTITNVNGVPVRYVIMGAAPGEIWEQTLMPGDRIDTGMPGVPASIAEARMIEASPIGLTCPPGGGSGSTDPAPPPPPLNTEVQMACR